MIAGEFDQLAERLKKAQENIGILSNWCADLELALGRAGIHVVQRKRIEPPALIDMPDPEPLDRHRIHEEKEGKPT